MFCLCRNYEMFLSKELQQEATNVLDTYDQAQCSARVAHEKTFQVVTTSV